MDFDGHGACQAVQNNALNGNYGFYHLKFLHLYDVGSLLGKSFFVKHHQYAAGGINWQCAKTRKGKSGNFASQKHLFRGLPYLERAKRKFCFAKTQFAAPSMSHILWKTYCYRDKSRKPAQVNQR
jgi:hypothetical protein